MRTSIGFLSGASLFIALAACGAASAAAQDADADSPPARFRLTGSHVEPAPQQHGRYSLHARFQREESVGELREGGEFVLIGRFAKAGVGCDASIVFRNGFEG